MSKVVTVQDYLMEKDPEKYAPVFSKEAEAEVKKQGKADSVKRELLKEIEDLKAENAELKKKLKEEKSKDK